MPVKKTILVTGACGYIGSHTCVELLNAGYAVIGYDNLCNSSRKALSRVGEITGKESALYEADVRDRAMLRMVLQEHRIDAVIHFAGLKAVGESVANPLKYFDNNVAGTGVLLQALAETGVKRFLFSSSATVYGEPESSPVPESARLIVANPYGRTKLMVEQMLEDLCRSDPEWIVGVLRYFNPGGAHPSGQIGEDPRGVPNNLMPFVSQVAAGRRERLAVFGGDYPTPDGTGMRDYIHVVDLARGHVAALNRMFDAHDSFTVNLGTGRPYSVLEIVHAFEAACGRRIPYDIVARRSGDVPIYYADPSLAKSVLGWQAEMSIEDMCADHWRWQRMNPRGYEAPDEAA